MKLLLPISTALLLTASLSAQSYVIDFEDFNTGGGAYEDVSESLLLADVGGSGIDVTINGGADNRVYDLVQFGGYTDPGPQALIDWNWSSYQNTAGTDIEFSAPIGSMSLIAGDFGGDDDSPITITAYNAAGAVVDSDTTPWNGNPPFTLLSVSGSGIVRVHYSSGGQYTNSTFFDDITFEADGPTLAVTGLTAGGMATASVSGATPGGSVIIGYSIVGPGPTNVALSGCGVVTALLSNPKLLASGIADAGGSYSFNGNVPPNASGIPVWFHAIDVASCQTTNGLAEVVQ